MPAVNASTLEPAPAGATRRRAWAHPEVKSHSLVVLTSGRLHATPLAGAPRPETLAAVDSGDLDELLGPFAVTVDLALVRRAKLDLLTNSLVVEYARAGSSAGRLTVAFATPEAADACFTKLWRRLDGHRLRPYKRDVWAAARGPLALLAGVLLATALLVLMLSVFEDAAPARTAAQLTSRGSSGTAATKSPAEMLVGWADWRWVCAAGGAAAAASQVWLYRRLTRPPVALELVRT